MKRPEYVRGALFSSHAHYWDYMTGTAWTPFEPTTRQRMVYGAIVWRKRRKVMND